MVYVCIGKKEARERGGRGTGEAKGGGGAIGRHVSNLFKRSFKRY